MTRLAILALFLISAHAQQDQDEFTKRELKKVESAQRKLEQNPEDPEANEAVGRFHSFILNDWGKGLPLMEKAKNVELRTLATKDRGADQADDAAHVSIGDEWWKMASKYKGTEAKNIMGRAAYWYRRALPKASKETRQTLLTRLDKHLKLIGPVVIKVPANAQWTDTGLDLLDGEGVVFSVTGRWCINNNPEKEAWCDYKGYPLMRAKIVPMPGKSVGCLIAKIGDEGVLMVVSEFMNLGVARGGRLYIGPNNVPPDNAPGEMTVTLQRSLR